MSNRAHRRPPLPHWDKGKGTCRWCGEACEPTRQWHGPCVSAYKIACWPSAARKAVWHRDKGICGICKSDIGAQMEARRQAYSGLRFAPRPVDGDYWQADHIVPLVEANRGDLSLWSLDNLRVLCTACHRGETKALAGRRATARKANVPTLP